jgi:hypothetical protein
MGAPDAMLKRKKGFEIIGNHEHTCVDVRGD